MKPNGKTILDYFKLINRSSTNDNIQYFPIVKEGVNRTKPTNNKIKYQTAKSSYECIIIDDDGNDGHTKKKKKNKKGQDDDIQLIAQREK